MADLDAANVTRGRMFWLVLFKSLKIRNRVSITFFGALQRLFRHLGQDEPGIAGLGAHSSLVHRPPRPAAATETETITQSLVLVPADKLIGASPCVYGGCGSAWGNAVLAGVDFSGLKKLSPYWQVTATA